MELISKPTLVVFFALTLFAPNSTGCAPKVNDFRKETSIINRMTASWVGHHQSELIARWGPPTKVVPDGKGGNIVTYESLKARWGDQIDKRIVGGANYPTIPLQAGYRAIRTFYVNENGIIYACKWSGL
jgi:hypothetical protein